MPWRRQVLFFVDSVLKQYQANHTIYRPRKDVVTVISPQYLLPTFDLGQLGTIKSRCRKLDRQLSKTQITAVCDKLRRTNYENKVSKQSYANHYWLHVIMLKPSWKTKDVVDIHDIISDPHHGKLITEHKLTREYAVPFVQMGPFLWEDEQNR